MYILKENFIGYHILFTKHKKLFLFWKNRPFNNNLIFAGTKKPGWNRAKWHGKIVENYHKFKLRLQYLTWIIETKSIPGNIYRNSGMVHFPEINQAPSTCSMLQHIGRVATPKLVPRKCLRYLQTTLIIEGGGLVSEFMWGIV